MLVITGTDFPNPPKTENYFGISDLFESHIPRRILEIFFQNDAQSIDEILGILQKAFLKQEITPEEFDFLHKSVLHPRFYRFYKTQIVYKKGVSGILTDASVPYAAEKIQSLLNAIILPQSSFFEILRTIKVRLLMLNSPVGQEINIDGNLYIRLMYKDQSTIFFREKKSKNTLLLRKLERNKEQFTYHSTLGLRENNFGERNMILSDFGDFFIGEKEVIHTTSGVKIYVGFDAQIIEGPRGMTALISAHGTKAVLVSPSGKILRNLGEGNTENLLYNARVQKKRESLAFIEKIEYSRDTGKLVVYYGKYFLYRESDFSDDWEKQEFRRVRKSFKKEERGVTYSVLSNGVLEEIQL